MKVYVGCVRKSSVIASLLVISLLLIGIIVLGYFVVLRTPTPASRKGQFGHVRALEYSVYVYPKDRDSKKTLSRVTVYLPCPRENGKPADILVTAIRTDYSRFREISNRLGDDKPAVVIEPVDTHYGKMLRISSLTPTKSLYVFGTAYYATLFPVGLASKEYPLTPVMGKKSKTKRYLSTSPGRVERALVSTSRITRKRLILTMICQVMLRSHPGLQRKVFSTSPMVSHSGMRGTVYS